MHVTIYIISGLFILMACGLAFAFHRTRRVGLMVMGITYAASAGLAIVLMHWWPLVAGFILVWILRFLGLDPDTGSKEQDR